MSSMIIRGTRILEYSGFCNASGQFTVEFKCRANWSEPVCQEMDWTVEPHGFGNGNLDGCLHGINMILEPNKAALKDYRFDIGISKVDKFKHVARVKDGEVEGRELEFVVTSVADDAGAVVEAYIRHCGPGDDRGQARIQFNAEEQQTLPTGEGNAAPEANEKVRGRKKAAEAVQ